ncbi:MAG: nodulation protein NfeD [Ignavibacteriaceae bacterium]|nr:nodulation protein NfeD [Ignavibacteriaceae bacterium]
MSKFIYIFAVLTLLNISSLGQPKKVVVINVDGAIQPACSDYIRSGIEKATRENAECLIIKLNTPGGLLKSTRVIVTDILQSKVPIIVYVAPSGSQAASAGVFVTIAAHIAAMAPGTNIGAAHPVTLQGTQDSIMMEKATNDAAAFIRTISEKRNRNIQWSEDAVRKSLSITENEALKLHVIDLIAKDVKDLLAKIDGKEVETSSGKVLLNTKNTEIIDLDMTISQILLNILSDPNLLYILFMLGIYGLFFELYNPGAIFPGVIGGICLILALYSMHTLPINYAGLALIVFALILFVLEIKIVSHGILSVGGVISLILGSIMLIDVDSFGRVFKISWEIITTVVVLTILFFFFAITLGIKAQRRKPTTGAEGMIGEIGVAISDLDPEGEVMVHGEIWNSESLVGKIKCGQTIKVEEISHLKLKVSIV